MGSKLDSFALTLVKTVGGVAIHLAAGCLLSRIAPLLGPRS
jgi:hypothetical protein